MPEKTFAQTGYEAYVKSTGGLNYQGLPCPKWEDLPAKIQTAWGAAALAIRSRTASEFDSSYDDLELSAGEAAELIAGLDALQVAGAHRQEVTVPLRVRLRAFSAPEPEDDAPDSDGGAAQSASIERTESPSTANPSDTAGPLKGSQEPAPPVAVYHKPTGTYVHPDAAAKLPQRELDRATGAAPPSEAAPVVLPKLSEAPPAPELKVDLGSGSPTNPTEAQAEAKAPAPSVASAHTPDAPPSPPSEAATAKAPAAGVIPAGKVQTSAQAAHTQTPSKK